MNSFAFILIISHNARSTRKEGKEKPEMEISTRSPSSNSLTLTQIFLDRSVIKNARTLIFLFFILAFAVKRKIYDYNKPEIQIVPILLSLTHSFKFLLALRFLW